MSVCEDVLGAGPPAVFGDCNVWSRPPWAGLLLALHKLVHEHPRPTGVSVIV